MEEACLVYFRPSVVGLRAKDDDSGHRVREKYQLFT